MPPATTPGTLVQVRGGAGTGGGEWGATSLAWVYRSTILVLELDLGYTFGPGGTRVGYVGRYVLYDFLGCAILITWGDVAFWGLGFGFVELAITIFEWGDRLGGVNFNRVTMVCFVSQAGGQLVPMDCGVFYRFLLLLQCFTVWVGSRGWNFVLKIVATGNYLNGFEVLWGYTRSCGLAGL